MFDLIARALGWIFYWIYNFVDNYGVALIIFTVLIKICMVPMSIKQQKSTIKMQQIQPLIKDIQEKYKNDQQKMQAETMKLYKEHDVKVAAGCLPMLIQLPILICLYQVISYPLTYIFGFSAQESWEAISRFEYSGGVMLNEAIRNGSIHGSIAQIKAATEMFKLGEFGGMNFMFLGMDLSLAPNHTGWVPNIMWVIPALAAFTTYLTSKISMSAAKKRNNTEEDQKPKRVLNPEAKPDKGDQTQQTTQTMNVIMPFFTLWLAFTYSASLGFYWLLSNIVAILQQLYINKKYGSLYAEEIGEVIKEKEYEQKIKRLSNHKKKK